MTDPIEIEAAPAAGELPRRRPRAPLERRLFPFVFGILAIAALAPIWRVRFLPLLDEPNHVASVYIWHYYKDPAARLQEFYQLNIQPVPYFAYHCLVHFFTFITGLEAANKIVLSGYVLSLPAAALLWTRRTKRSPWLSILAFPLAYSYSWSYGFQPFNIGLSAFLFAALALDAYLERPRVMTGAAALLLAICCDLGHPLALLALYSSALALLAAWRPRIARAMSALLLLVPSAALFAWQVFRPQASFVATARAAGTLYEGQHLPVLTMLRELPVYTLDSIAGHADLVVFWIIAGAGLLLFISGLFMRRTSGELRGGRLRSYRAALIMAAMLVCYLVVPLHLFKPFDWWFVSGRFAPLVCFFALLMPAGAIRGARLFLVAPAAAAALFLPLYISQKYAAFNERTVPFVRMVEETRPGTDVLFLSMRPRGDPDLNVEAYNQFASWVQVLHGGYSGSGWFNTGYPFKVKKHLPGPPWYNHEAFNAATMSGPYEYVIVHNERRPIFSANQKDFRLVRREGEWTLYARVTEPR